MPSIVADVALLTDRRYTADAAEPDDWYLGNILADDGLLRDALARRGLKSVRVDWADASVDWSAFGCAVRTTWDYFERFAEFTDWLNHVETKTRLCNPADTIRWNVDKNYLHDLEALAVPVVPSHFLRRGSARPLGELLTLLDWDEAVIKPCVSGAARHTYRVNRRTANELQPLLSSLLETEAMIVQPFMADIAAGGEDSLMVIGGRFTHAVKKRVKAGDFRVQDDHGGTVHPHTPTAEQIELAERAFRVAVRPVPLYGRADMVRDAAGRLAIMELELIEPELWLRMHPPAADTFADAIVDFLSRR